MSAVRLPLTTGCPAQASAAARLLVRACVVAALILGASKVVTAQVLSGSYTGDGTDARAITELGFQPDVVIVKGDTAERGVMRTAAMTGDAAKPIVGGFGLAANLIQSLDATGFTVGSDPAVNGSGVEYYWIAFKQASKRMTVGSYLGNGVGQGVPSVGFSPEFVIVMAAGTPETVWRSSADDESFSFGTSTGSLTWITSLDADGFTVAADSRVNAINATYYYVAWNEVAGVMDVGSYAGNNSDPRLITAPGFEPEYVLLKRDGASNAVHHPASLGKTIDSTLYFTSATSVTNRIQALTVDGFEVGGSTDVNLNPSNTYNYVAWRRVVVQTEVLTGSYVGDGVDNRQITGLAFKPDLVIIKGDTAQNAVLRAYPWAGDFTKDLIDGTVTADRIQSLDTEGFTVGTDARVNSNGVTYHWIAWIGGAGEMTSGTYIGDGVSGRNITEFGFAPAFVIVLGSTAEAVYRNSAASSAFSFDATSGAWISALGTDGFTVSNDARVNANGVTYAYIAWPQVSGKMAVGTYAGDGADDRSITGVGFQPEYAFVHRDTAGYNALHHPRSIGASTDSTLFFDDRGSFANYIQALEADGFQVGNQSNVNAASATYVYAAWAASTITAVRMASTTATRMENGVRVSWQTGYEVDNLGFNVYREAGGERTRVTEKPIAGSGLLVAPGVAITASQSYRWTDASPQALEKDVAYWLEDIDLNGKRTWHGPIAVTEKARSPRLADSASTPRDRLPGELSDTPSQESAASEPEPANSPLLSDLARAGSNAAAPSPTAEPTPLAPSGGGGVVYQVAVSPAVTSQSSAPDVQAAPAVAAVPVSSAPAASAPNAPAAVNESVSAPASSTSAPKPTASVTATAPSSSGTMALASLDVTVASSGSGTTAPQSFSVPQADPPATAQAVRIRASPPSGAPRPPEPAHVQEQWAVASRAGARVAIRAAGWYRLTQPALVAAGIDPAANPKNLRLVADGVELPMRVTGEQDDAFDAGDTVEFYATGIDTPFTDVRAYWITSGTSAGLRLPTVDARTSGTPAGTSFAHTVERKPRHVFFSGLQNGEKENFFGAAILDGSITTETVTLAHVAPGGSAAQLEVALQGVTALPASNDHRVGVLVNGTEVGEMLFDGRAAAVASFVVPHALLVSGANTITFEARGGPDDISLVDVLRLTYQREYRADANQVTLTANAGQQLTITGFTDDAVRVWDVTGGAASRELIGTVAVDGGGWSIVFTMPSGGARTLFVAPANVVGTPAAIQANVPSALHDAGQSGEVVMIADASFASALVPLRDLRLSQGYTVKIVDVQDIYDEFSFGRKDPAAIRAFLVRASEQWTKTPRFVLLVGNATSDPRNYQGLGEPDFVPTRIVPTGALETASDDWFVDADGDGYTELGAIGRLPARTAAHVTTMVDKIVAYEQSSPESWHNTVLLVSDQGDDDLEEFASLNQTAAQFVPSGYQVTHLKRHEDPTPAQTLKARLADGAVVVNYQGHGSVQVWRGDVLTADDVPALGNGSRLPFVVAMTCLGGFFHGLHPEASLAEALVRTAGGGAVGVWASSGLTDSRWQSSMDRELFRQMFRGSWVSIGEAIRAAKKVVGNPDVRRTWIYFGDPALRMKGLSRPPVESTPTVTPVSSPPDPGAPPADDDENRRRSQAPPVRLADFDGDAQADALIAQPETGAWFAALGVPGSFRYVPGQFPVAGQPIALNLNGDARADVFVYDPQTGAWLRGTSQGDGTFLTTIGGWPAGMQVVAGDFDGNGRDDLFAHHPNGTYFHALVGPGSFAYRFGEGLQPGQAHPADFNGDGRVDVFLFDAATGQWTIAFSTAGAPTILGGTWSPGWQALVANLNGDTSADVVLWHALSGTWVQCLRDAAQVFTYRSGTWSPGGRMYTANLTGDGREELFRYDWRTGDWTMGTTSLAGVMTQWDGLWEAGWDLTPGRLNGDSRDDFVLYNPETGEWTRRLNFSTGWVDDASGLWSQGWIVAGRLR